MGNPHWRDDLDKQCYNAAKSYQIARQGAWYEEKYVKDLDTRNEPYWSGTLIGVAEYDKISDGGTVLLKIETGKSEDYFVAFNRKIGPNANNKMASDQVMSSERVERLKQYLFDYSISSSCLLLSSSPWWYHVSFRSSSQAFCVHHLHPRYIHPYHLHPNEPKDLSLSSLTTY